MVIMYKGNSTQLGTNHFWCPPHMTAKSGPVWLDFFLHNPNIHCRGQRWQSDVANHRCLRIQWLFSLSPLKKKRPYSGVSSLASSQKCVFTYQTRNMLTWIPPKMGEHWVKFGKKCRIAAILNTIFTIQQSTKGSVKISSPIGVWAVNQKFSMVHGCLWLVFPH